MKRLVLLKYNLILFNDNAFRHFRFENYWGNPGGLANSACSVLATSITVGLIKLSSLVREIVFIRGVSSDTVSLGKLGISSAKWTIGFGTMVCVFGVDCAGDWLLCSKFGDNNGLVFKSLRFSLFTHFHLHLLRACGGYPVNLVFGT